MRKICVVILSRANYGRVKSVMSAIQRHKKLQLQLIVGGSANLYRFGNVSDIIEKDGFRIDQSLSFAIEGDEPATMAKTTGLGIIQISSALEILKPDVVITVADRYETMATAIAASYQNIVLAHIQGGEVTGSIDESVRHAITKLSHIHFPSTEISKSNIIKMGENENFVFNVGCPSIDALKNEMSSELDLAKLSGVGYNINPHDEFNLVVFHPVTTSLESTSYQTKELVKAVDKIGKPTIWMWPNIDAGTDTISKILREYRETNYKSKIRFIRNLPVETYNRLLATADCLIGNSSSFIREASFLGARSVIVGDRQNMRELAKNAQRSKSDAISILNTYHQIIDLSPNPSNLYGTGTTGELIAELLTRELPPIQKLLTISSR